MAVRQIRRLDPAPRDRWEWATRKAAIRAFWLGREAFAALRDRFPSRVIDEPAGLVAGEVLGLRPEMLVHFAFGDRRACEEGFGPMFNRLLDVTPEREEVSDGFVVEFTDRPNRNYVEPVLKQQGFETDSEWLEFVLVDLDIAARREDAGLRLSEAGPADARALAAAAQAYGAQKLTPEGVCAAFAAGQRVWWAEASGGARIGYMRISVRPGGRTGIVHDLAVIPEKRGAGLGDALLWVALWELRSMGALEASVRIDTGNAPGIAMLRRAGFRQAEAGVTYRRPASDDEVRRRFEAKRGHAVKFGGWR
jgi:ribosomal protein S18 acetylase RimI-like enzyme